MATDGVVLAPDNRPESTTHTKRANPPAPMNLAVYDALLGIPAKTLHRWAGAGLAHPVDDKRRGRRFHLADFRRIASMVRTDGRMGA